MSDTSLRRVLGFARPTHVALNRGPQFTSLKRYSCYAASRTAVHLSPRPNVFSQSRAFHSSKPRTFQVSSLAKATHRDRGGPYGSSGSRSSWRRSLDGIRSQYIFLGVAGLNVLVFGQWYLAQAQYQQNRDPSWLKHMLENYTVSWRNVVQEGRVWTMLTACFSHQSLNHFFFNGLGYYFMAPVTLAMLGNTSFLALYLGGGLICSTASLLYNNKSAVSSQGASGAIYAIMSFFACANPTAKFLIMGIVPCPSWVWVGGIFAYDMYRSVAAVETSTDTAGHVGGLVFGAAYYLWRARTRSF